MDDMDAYFEGRRLYGDDFSAEQIAAWYEDEKEGYADLGAKDASQYHYEYHAWNRYHAYRHLTRPRFEQVMGFGSAYGDELLPIIDRIGRVTIVDPSDAFVKDRVHGVPATFVKPSQSGDLPLPSDTFDLITCLGVLHHIPNVSHVVSELARTLKPGCQLVLREPIVSMGDWRQPRRGVTRRERGIPLALLDDIIARAGLHVERRALCAFPLTPRLFGVFGGDVYNNTMATVADSMVCKAFAWNVNYHPRTTMQKFRPTSAFYVLTRPMTR